MRRALPWLVLLAAAAVAVLAWKTDGFGLAGGDRTDDVAVDRPPSEIDGEGGLASHAARRGPDADPKTYEGDPVARLVLDLGKAAVTGRVTTDGNPVRFARVLPVLAPPNESRGVRTSKDGRFEIQGLPAGPLDVRVSAEGCVPRTVAAPTALADGVTTDLGEIALKARPPASDGLEVKVLDPAGRPVAGAKVVATTMAYGLYLTLGPKQAGVTDVIAREGATDDLGVARFFPLPAEKYDVVVRAPDFVLEPVQNVVVAAGRVEHLVVTLRPGLSMSGTVVDLQGTPVGGAFVTVLHTPSFRSFEAVRTDGTGAWTITGLIPGQYMVVAGAEGKGEGQSAGVNAGERNVRIELKGTGTLKGQVVLADGKPAPSFVLRPYPAQPFRYVYSVLHEFHDADGRFSLDLAPGAYQLDVKAEGASFTSTTTASVPLGAAIEVKITLPAEGVVAGVVTGPDGDQLQNAEVYVKRGGFPPVPVREQYARTDADGHFALRSLPLEPVKLHVRHAAYALKVIDATPAPPGQATEITVRLSAGSHVVGRVTGKDGAPVAGERVNLSQGFDFFGARTVLTGSDGAYHFDAVAAGDYMVSTGRFDAAGTGQRRPTKVPEEGTVTVDFTVEGDQEATGVVQGRVTMGDAPVAGATVLAMDDRGFNDAVTARTESDGRYVAKGLKPGTVRVSVSTASGLQDTASARIEKPGDTVTVDVAFGSAGIRATLVASDGRTTVSGAWCTVERSTERQGTAGWESIAAQMQSDNAGVVTSSGLDPGTYRIRITGTGYAARLTDPFALGEGEVRDLGSIRLQAGGGIAGRVSDETGAPIEGIGVSLKNARGEDVFLFNLSSTGSNGRYEIQGIELGTYTVRFEGKGYAPVDMPAEVTASGAAVDAVMRRGGALVARVEDEAGQPVPGARVQIFDASGQPVRRTLSIVNLFDGDVSRTNAQGVARIPDLAPAGYRVTAGKDGWTPLGDPVAVTIASGADTSVKVVMKAAK